MRFEPVPGPSRPVALLARSECLDVMPGYDDARKNDQRQGRGNQSSNCYRFLSFPRFPNGVVLNKAGRARHQVVDIAFVWCGRLASENLQTLASGTADAVRVGEC